MRCLVHYHVNDDGHRSTTTANSFDGEKMKSGFRVCFAVFFLRTHRDNHTACTTRERFGHEKDVNRRSEKYTIRLVNE